jgi:ankyrin repeat protein
MQKLGIVTLAVVFALAVTASLRAQPSVPAGAAGAVPDFDAAIRPIFVNRCTGCHGASVQRAGLRLDDREAAMKGSMNGPVIVPGHSESSKLYAMVASKRMPLDDELSVLELNNLKSWINGGAPWPAKRVIPGMTADARVDQFRLALRNQDDPAIVRLLADPALVKLRDANGNTALHQAAVYGEPAQVRALLDRGADVNAINLDGVTPLIWSVRDDAAANLLIDRGADVNAVSDGGISPLVAAAGRADSTALIRRLVEKGAHPSLPQQIAIGAAAGEMENLETLKLLFPKVLEINGPAARPAVAGLIYGDCTACLDYMLAQGARGATLDVALVLAANAGDAAQVKRLLDLGATLDGRGPQDATVLIAATMSDREPLEKVKLLLAAGADVNAADAHGRTPLLLANRLHPEVTPLLLAKGAK